MAIKIAQGFQITSANPIDPRLVLTKNQMKAVNDNVMPSQYFTLCPDDNKIYIYTKTNTANDTTGKFKPAEADGVSIVRGYYYNNNFYIDNTHTLLYPKSIDSIYMDKHKVGQLYLYDGTNFNAISPLDNKSLDYSADGLIELKGYKEASEGQIPVKHNTNGITWIDQDEAISYDDIMEILD